MPATMPTILRMRTVLGSRPFRKLLMVFMISSLCCLCDLICESASACRLI